MEALLLIGVFGLGIIIGVFLTVIMIGIADGFMGD